MNRDERLVRSDTIADVLLAPGVEIRFFCNGSTGAHDLTVCSATMAPGTEIPYHTHPTGEGISVLEGTASAYVEGRRYELHRLDAIYVPTDIAHSVRNESGSTATLHTSFPTGSPDRVFLEDNFAIDNRSETDANVAEHLVRAATATRHTLLPEISCWDFFCEQTGATGIQGGNTAIPPLATLPCPALATDTSIAVSSGNAVVTIQDQQYELKAFDALFVPSGTSYEVHNPGEIAADVIRVSACG
ncbi:MAG: cupin domain-containing protein [Planctomycetota bacterium]|nr:cupin domain-containing protein [Planctomycetota bacterium]